MTQTELPLGRANLEAPYNGLFYCFIRKALFRWPEYHNFYVSRNL